MSFLSWFLRAPPVHLRKVPQFDPSRLPIGILKAPEPHQEAIEGACEFWNRTHGREVFFPGAQVLDQVTTIIPVKSSKKILLTANLRVIHGQICSAVISYNPDRILDHLWDHIPHWHHDEAMVAAWAHEIGHCQGLKKNGYDDSVMRGYISPEWFGTSEPMRDYLRIPR